VRRLGGERPISPPRLDPLGRRAPPVGPSHDQSNPRSTQGVRRRPGARARRCLLKGCERWFMPARPQARYCGAACQAAAKRWRAWKAQQRYRQTARGRACRCAQSRRHRRRQREGPRSGRDHPRWAGAWVITQRQIFLPLRSAWLLCDVPPSSSIAPAAILCDVLSARAGTGDRARAPVAAPLAGAPASACAWASAASGAYCGTHRSRVTSL
jgi:hypothetical protein